MSGKVFGTGAVLYKRWLVMVAVGRWLYRRPYARLTGVGCIVWARLVSVRGRGYGDCALAL